ncbi:integrin alpha-7 isoform X4 [Canis lupus baileyi]|uniref:Integrin alpha-7 n=3 Tax=Canis lupus TaxID=9612 RepID=A0A8C0Q2Y5_CANLF|nr:integrin alpha-7 isoform X6 [Canis lupus familiaris]XP_025332890.1 integrin alpha-7 isoform X4 [Canis lupus dingo]XP_038405505.1 integrin alpha-7 isoform X6 [Canis lupus familiaris]XP_038534839.1 integrin alpha-7 isoform X6 [Canis lupus familiaris]|eukprot:XP_003431513.1 integrin alpha-7 isoform X4 [Canis lupus familiaris]
MAGARGRGPWGPPGIRCLLGSLLAALLAPGAVAFNLDVTGALSKEGEPGSLFGFSVALHRQLQPRPQSWLLVGAPQALALPGQQANRTGGLFACPLSLEETDCYRVDIDRGADVQKESKENQWLGVSVRSQGPGGKIVTCAHRYEARQRVDQILETRDVIGRCFVLSQDLAARDELDGGEWKFCEGRPQGHEQFGFCQQGTAAAFSPDSHYLLFGAPGTYNWKGTARVELCAPGSVDLAHLDDGPYEAGGEKEQDPRLIPVPANSYFGFSIDSGKGLVRAEELSFVAGAPRANHKGAVVILRKDSASRLVPEVMLSGERLTSGFGYSLAVADLNNDGWTDLVVGAPYFFERQEELGGAVYVYLNQGGHWAGVSPLRLCGSPDSMFGISLAVLGDLNQDGFADIAVGAPFDGDGKVFIYHGSSLGVVVKPSQVLEGEAVGVKSFGYSLSGGLDVDGNHYPDLLVGSLADTAVLFRARPILQVSHEVFIAPRTIDLEQPNCAAGHLVCVDLRVCFSYIATPSSYSPIVALDYVLDGDTDRRLRGQVPRVTFLSRGPDDPKHQSSGTVWLKHQHDRVCGDTMFQLQENVKDKLRAIVVTLSYNLQTPRLRRQAPGQGLPPVAPILNAHQSSTQRTEIHFLKQGCGEDKVCQSNLQLVQARFCARVSDSEFQPLPMDADGTTALFALSGQPVIGLELTVTNLPSDPAQPQADGDDAHEAQLLVTLPASLHYSGVRALDPAEKPLCVSNENASHVECELGNPMKRGAQVTFYLILSTSGITIETTELEVELLLATISEQDLHLISVRARVFIELPLSIAGVAVPQQLFFSGVVRGESAMKSERDIGSKVKYEVTVSNQGQSLNTLGSAFLNIMWPHEIANGKWLLYPMRVELEGGQGPRRKGLCSPRPNILHLDVDSRDRRRRELEQPKQEEHPEHLEPSTSWWPVSSAEKKKNITLDCARGTANCVVFSCPLYSFDRAAVLHVWGRLWNSTFLEEYSAVKSLEVTVRANITVKSSIKNLVLRDASTVIPVMVYLDPVAVVAEGVPWWVILLAVLAGLLVLALLVLLMWKMGFFKRARYPEATVPQYHAVKIPREDRQQFKEEKTGTILRNNWGSPRREGPDAHPILAADGHPEPGSDGHPMSSTA